MAAYGASMVLAPRVSGRLFSALGFGMAEAGIVEPAARDHVLFLYGMLGSVIVGWMALLVAVAALPLQDGGHWACRALATSLDASFLLDTTLSLILGQWQHAVFNTDFLAALGLPLLAWRRQTRRTSPQAGQPSR